MQIYGSPPQRRGLLQDPERVHTGSTAKRGRCAEKSHEIPTKSFGISMYITRSPLGCRPSPERDELEPWEADWRQDTPRGPNSSDQSGPPRVKFS